MLTVPNQKEPPHSDSGSTRSWNRRLIILLTILAALALAVTILWGISHITTSVLVVVIATLIAYAIAPAVEILHKVMPRALAILLAYLLVNILLTVVISIYLLIYGAHAFSWIRNATPRSHRGQLGSTIEILQRVVGGYIRGQILLCTIIGFLVGVGLFIIGFPFAVLMGVLTFVTEFIPVLGTIFAGTVAVLLALTQGWVKAIIVLIFFVLVHIFEGYILAPRLIGKAVQLNPAIMLIALTIGSELFGPFGAIFAAPTAGLLQALVTAIWIQYRQTHKEEFLDKEPESTTKQLEELPVKATTSTIPAGKDTTI